MTASTRAPLEALRRLIAEVKQLDAVEVGARWNQLQGELGVAEGVVRDFLNSDIIIANRLRDAAADPMWDSHAEVSKRLLTLAAENMEVARARIIELERAPVAAQPSEAAQREELQSLLTMFDMGLGFALCHRDFGETRSAIKKLQQDFIAIRIAIFAAPTAAVSAAPSGEVERDAKLWRTFTRVLRTGHIPGTAHGRRFKIIERCPMYSDETEFNDFIGAIEALATKE